MHATVALFRDLSSPISRAFWPDRCARSYWLTPARVLDRDDLAGDPRFSTNERRVKNRAALIRILEREFRRERASHWVSRCRRASIPASLVRGVREALRTTPGRALVGTLEHPEIGRYEAVRNPIRSDGARHPLRTPPPALGQHTDAILAELGFSGDDIRRFRSAGVI
jgi:crotonobetainyl-CoA:carnitine CoA-transferase CaiB-like acyl-CoA transferase